MTSPQTAVSSGSEQKKMSKHLRNEVIEKSELRRLIFICAVPWDIRLAAFVRLCIKFHVQQLFEFLCFPRL